MRSDRKKIPLRDLRTISASRAVRHPDCDYAGDIDVHLIVCADDGKPFEDDAVAAIACENVEFYSRKLGYRLYGYCLMPDHLHFLLSPGKSKTEIGEWLRQFKSYTTNRYTRTTGRPVLWQRSAYDHVCREEETAEKVLAYIVQNPVRSKLVENWQDWRWTKVFIVL
jgi:putative transposase